MRTKIFMTMTVLVLFLIVVINGCSKSTGPIEAATNNGMSGSENVLVQSLSTQSVVTQDVSQLSKAGTVTSVTSGLFVIGWKQFVGPNISDTGTIGQAFAVVRSDSTPLSSRASGLEIGTVTLIYGSTSLELTKRTTPDGGILYSTFDKGLHDPQAEDMNIPFIANGVYQFSITGSSSFTAGSFSITAPASLLKLTSNKDGDTISVSNDLNLTWIGGSQTDSVLIRVVPHLKPQQIMGRCPMGQPKDDHQGGRGMFGGHGGPPPVDKFMGDSLDNRMPLNLGPEFQKGFIKTLANTGTFTISAADLQNLISGTEAGEVMVDVAQLIEQNVQHDSKAIKLLLRNGDRLVLKLQ